LPGSIKRVLFLGSTACQPELPAALPARLRTEFLVDAISWCRRAAETYGPAPRAAQTDESNARFTSRSCHVNSGMSISEEEIKNPLKAVKYPGFPRDIVSFGLVKSIQIDNGDVKVQVALATTDPNVPATIKNDAERALRTIEGIRSAKVLIDIHAPPGGAGAGTVATRIPGVRHVIAVASGKGGVGKSTVAANLAVALKQTGTRVGLCDC